jgi:hypothetical protein
MVRTLIFLSEEDREELNEYARAWGLNPSQAGRALIRHAIRHTKTGSMAPQTREDAVSQLGSPSPV